MIKNMPNGVLTVLYVLLYCSLIKSQNDEDTEGTQTVSITVEQVNAAAQQALNSVRSRDNLEAELVRRGLATRRGSASFFHHALFQGDPQQLAQSKWSGLVEIETSKQLIKDLQLKGVLTRRINRVTLNDTVIQEACPKPPVCDPTKYRSADGSCNNLDNLSWGKSFTSFQRLLPPRYDDGVDSPKQTSVDRGPLPSPRNISWQLAPDVDASSSQYTLMVMQWGQFIDHDLTNTAITTTAEGFGITCCDEEVQRNESLRHPACFSIPISSIDPFYSSFGQTCMEFVRSMAAPREQCSLGPRQQLNMLTHFIDGSMVYGSTHNESVNLRSFERGTLRSSPRNGVSILPPNPNTACAAENANETPCFLAGDSRVNEQTNLAVFHQIWFREHNRIAGILANLNPGWNDEILYQEARRIVGAMIQHITYNEFLPILLGQRLMAAFQLNLQRKGQINEYNKKINPTLSTVFASAAYRLGHTLVQGSLQLRSRLGEVTDNLKLSTQFFNPSVIYTEEIFDMLIRGMAGQPSQTFDRFFTRELTNHLFAPPGQGFGLDLVSLNIQRGRDHGLPSYNEWREFCNLTRLDSFDDLSNAFRQGSADIFRNLYRHVDDIDVYPGGFSENPTRRDALLPPLFGCLVAEQFHRLKFGDRFWYENGDMDSSFSEAQLDEIRKVTLARVLCDNSNIQFIQRQAFLISSPRNPVEPCIQGKIPRMKLEPWKNEPIWT